MIWTMVIGAIAGLYVWLAINKTDPEWQVFSAVMAGWFITFTAVRLIDYARRP